MICSNVSSDRHCRLPSPALRLHAAAPSPLDDQVAPWFEAQRVTSSAAQGVRAWTAGQEEEPLEERQDYVSFVEGQEGRADAEDLETEANSPTAGHQLPRCNSSSDDDHWQEMNLY